MCQIEKVFQALAENDINSLPVFAQRKWDTLSQGETVKVHSDSRYMKSYTT